MQIEPFLASLRARRFYHNQIVHLARLPRRAAHYGRLARPLPRPLEQALNRTGVKQFYSHQAEAINAIRQGEHVIVSTATASGKTLIYNVSVLEACLLDPQTRALYLFPTKALAQDQLRALGELTQGELSAIQVNIYDGDTPQATRGRIRQQSGVLLTNPDMLHMGILPNHHLWQAFFRRLRFVVMDEAHVYRGVFGSQVGCVLRRLRRICALYGSRPQFIACSATIANPAGHIAALTGIRPRVIDQDGAPQGPRTFVLWNPPLLDRGSGGRSSPNIEAAHLFAALTQAGIRNLTFARSRRSAELILSYAQKSLAAQQPELVSRIAAYRAGYMPEERRALEQALFDGQLIGLTTTSALELGIDVGHLDATVLTGYPGAIASMWQQAGRAGRGEQESLTVLIGQDNPLDQYLMRHPADLLSRPHEAARCNPGNPYVLIQHLPCAAHESPLTPDDEKLFGSSLSDQGYAEAMAHLEQTSQIEYRPGRTPAADRWVYVGGKYPAQEAGLRSAGGARIRLLDPTRPQRTLEEIEAATACLRVHRGAIYLHQGASYLVTNLDLQAGTATLRLTDSDYYTQPRELNDIRIIRSLQHRELTWGSVFYGRVRVTSQVIGFTRKKQFSDELLSEETLDLPPQIFESMAVWWAIPPDVARQVGRRGGDLAGGLHAVEHASIGMLPLWAMCDRLDLGGVSTMRHPDTDTPLICIYDGHAGGVGLAERGFEALEAWWQATLDTIKGCPCEHGCPSCIHSPQCGNNNEPLDKRAAIDLLRMLTGGG